MRIALTFALCLVLVTPGLAEEKPLGAAEKDFKRAMKSKLADARSAAFQHLRDVRDPGVMLVIYNGVETLKRDRKRIGKDQEAAEAEYEKQITAQNDLDKRWERSKKTRNDMKAYNKREKKISKARDAARRRLQDLENEFTRNEAMIQSATSVVAHILGALEPEKMQEGASVLATRWLLSENPEDRRRWIFSVWSLEHPWIAKKLQTLFTDDAQLPPVRAEALSALVSRDEMSVVPRAEKLLEASPEQFTLIAASIRALRKMHQRSSIEPLISFLKREDVARLRGDAHLALRSLTGEEHGPYEQPWAKWWGMRKKDFRMPTAPSSTRSLNAPKKGVTFYGVHTFSDRILFIVDISGSMSKAQKQGAAKSKMEIVRQELIGAVQSLSETSRFAVIFFNHSIIPWQHGIHDASEPNKKKVADWINETQEIGGTNIHDAIEAGFQIAKAGNSRPELDTIYFLTDGKPTAGKFQDPKRILKRVRDWNSTAHLKIHVIGIGDDHDVDFCKELAEIGDGQYVKR